MERAASLIEAKEIMAKNFIGPYELAGIAEMMPINVQSNIPDIPFSLEVLKHKQKDYLLILGASHMQNGEPLTIMSLRKYFGINPDISEPCFYNQDWYLKEDYVLNPLESKWYLIRKNVFQESRAKSPDEIKSIYEFPSAILCAYTFFAYWCLVNECIWKHDFIWCSDLDHNGDRIYVGKYNDIDGINKNGFSIHRHLSIRENYGSIEVL